MRSICVFFRLCHFVWIDLVLCFYCWFHLLLPFNLFSCFWTLRASFTFQVQSYLNFLSLWFIKSWIRFECLLKHPPTFPAQTNTHTHKLVHIWIHQFYFILSRLPLQSFSNVHSCYISSTFCVLVGRAHIHCSCAIFQIDSFLLHCLALSPPKTGNILANLNLTFFFKKFVIFLNARPTLFKLVSLCGLSLSFIIIQLSNCTSSTMETKAHLGLFCTLWLSSLNVFPNILLWSWAFLLKTYDIYGSVVASVWNHQHTYIHAYIHTSIKFIISLAKQETEQCWFWSFWEADQFWIHFYLKLILHISIDVNH